MLTAADYKHFLLSDYAEADVQYELQYIDRFGLDYLYPRYLDRETVEPIYKECLEKGKALNELYPELFDGSIIL